MKKKISIVEDEKIRAKAKVQYFLLNYQRNK